LKWKLRVLAEMAGVRPVFRYGGSFRVKSERAPCQRKMNKTNSFSVQWPQ
jgi:hypothetical protein